MKKKLLSLAMAAIMVLGLSTTAFAANGTVNTADLGLDASTTNTITIEDGKTYTATNENTTSPAETFSFTVTGVSVANIASTVTADNMPKVTVDSIAVNKGDASTTGTGYDLVINLPAYSSVGVYTYTIEESSSSNAGVTTDTTTYYLVVTVVNGDDGLEISAVALHSGSASGTKVDEIENEYSAGSLEVTKSVTGNLGDKDKEFSFTVTFTVPEGETVDWSLVTATIAGTVDTNFTVGEDGTYTFTLADDETASFTNLPYGVTYEVVEDDANQDGYETSYDDNEEGTINSASASTTITNDKDETVDTGIILDSAPYILILALVLLGAAYVISRRRLSDRY